jgi:ParB family transcriptional regulator, chromosome partitioning protein
MGKSSKEALGASGKKDCLLFDPTQLVIVDDVASAIHETAERPISEAFILNIKAFGVLEPITVRKNPETGKTEVVIGRRRVRALIEANKRLKKEGCETWRVPAIPVRQEAKHLMGMMFSENVHREGYSPLDRAKNMSRYLEMGKTEEECALTFGCSVATVKNSLALLDAPKAVQKAVANGQVTVSDGYKLARMDDPTKKLEELKAAAPKEPGKKRRSNGAAARKVVDGASGVRGKRELASKIEEIESAEHVKEMWRAGILAGLMWAMGDEAALQALVAK